MDIPYTTQARPDTGLFNAKLGIWLFLASEVMLFGALFSSYILLRVGADPGTWPHGLLNIPIGTFNTTVLITSSVTVVLAWSALKMGDFAKYRKIQAVTILCALGFVGIKSFEYKDKFTHYEIWMKDGRRVTGHLEGDPWFYTLNKAAAQKVETLTFVPDAHHYAEKWEGHKAFHSELKAEAAAGAHHLPPVKIPVADMKRLSAFTPAHSTYFGIYFTLTALHALHVIGGAAVIFYLWALNKKLWLTDPERYTNRVEVSGLFWHFVDLVWIFLFPVLYLL